MREGLNPNKDTKSNKENYLHQVILPVYIPNDLGYFREALNILEVCINSLVSSSSKKTFISIVSNGSSLIVEKYLEELYKKGAIQELMFTENIGKLNSIFKAVAGHNFPLVTIADSDTYFVAGWQDATYKIYNNYKKVGTVGLIPQFLSYQSNCEQLLFDEFFNNKLYFGKVEDPLALAEFYRSIGWEPNYPKERLEHILYLHKMNLKAIVGSGHVVATYRRELFKGIPYYNPYKMGGDSESVLDNLTENKGYYRLTTANNFAFHLGNKLDSNFKEILNKEKIEIGSFPLELFESSKKPILILYLFKKKIIQIVMKRYRLRMLFLKLKGLNKKARRNF